MSLASSLLRAGAVCTRRELRDLLGYGAKALETGVSAPKKYTSVLLFITKRMTGDMTAYLDDLHGDDLHFDSQTKGRLDAKSIHEPKLGLEATALRLENTPHGIWWRLVREHG